MKPQFDKAYNFQEDMAPVKKDGKWGYIKNPLNAKEKINSYEQAGAFIGTIYSIQGNEVIVAGKIAERVYMGDKLCAFNGENIIVLQAYFPMMTTSKYHLISGSLKDL
ncbi:MAG TPA: WG repeat-containing protein [Spirochaetota bacterium]|nr:WG repeat-containing protein [Spirochaetota bacterium]HOK92858.1 WG repeat-containing protein [Spirochaetota bacterium]HPP95543.1 WG repeat-containing protein [Spirochaetota bacterium]HRS62945.1 WG repeat-containing protein [Spirochaetota bacterium]